MLNPFSRYFYKFIFFSRNRQKVLLIALFGLIISSFSLLVLQSTMGGLQHKLKDRSKAISGDYLIQVHHLNQEDREKIYDSLKASKLVFSREYELEMLIKLGSRLFPVIVHGVDLNRKGPFLNNYQFESSLTGIDLSYKLGLSQGQNYSLISPAHTDSFFGDVPRSFNVSASDFIKTDVPEVDGYHLWVSLRDIQNLIGEETFNTFRIYLQDGHEASNEVFGKVSNTKQLSQILGLNENKEFKNKLIIKSWNDLNQTLVFALRLESTMMFFLFTSMSVLISLSIMSGLLIFLEKTKIDFMSFWILGSSKASLRKLTWRSVCSLIVFSTLLGVVLALLVLYLFDQFAFELLPQIFVDRQIPVFISWTGVISSFLIPSLIALFFSYQTFKNSFEDNSYIKLLRN